MQQELKIFSSLLFSLSNNFVIIPLFSTISIMPEAKKLSKYSLSKRVCFVEIEEKK
jgi:hypothetical protein